MANRVFDVVVFGATGYTGRLITKYLSAHTLSFSWAIAGRSKKKLEDLSNQLSLSDSVPILIADSSDGNSLEELCNKTNVVIACVGPFDKFGMPLVDACMKCKTHYIDITGEFTFVRKMIKKYHEAAISSGVFLVPSCGFDSVPSDLGFFLVNEQAQATVKGVALKYVKGYMSGGGSFSRGTAETMCNIYSSIKWEDLSAFSLNPIQDSTKGLRAPRKFSVGYDREMKSFTAPFLLSGQNEKVVRRSIALTHSGSNSTVHPWYMEGSMGGLVQCIIETFVFYFTFILLALPPGRWFARRIFFPAPGEGPGEAARKKYKFTAEFVGQTVTSQFIRAKIHSPFDAYTATAIFASEAALLLSQKAKAGGVSSIGLPGGVLTPSTLLGNEYLPRLQKAGIQVDLVKS